MTGPAYPDLRGKRVVVTGAAQGIGRALAEAFRDAGSRVAVVARGPVPWLAEGTSEAGADPTLPIECVRCDIRETAPLAAWLAALDGRGERVDVLVNNAGTIGQHPLIDASPDDLDALFDVNVRATFVVSQLFARHMRRHGGGVILCTASYAATLASQGYGLYAASKAALVSLTRSMAAEWAPYGVRVNAFSPGVVPTRMTEPALERNSARMLEQIALRRVGSGAEVAHAALFLASDASAYVTGVNLDVTGGKLIVQDPGAAWR